MGMKVRVSAPFPGQALLCLRVVLFRLLISGHSQRAHREVSRGPNFISRQLIYRAVHQD